MTPAQLRVHSLVLAILVPLAASAGELEGNWRFSSHEKGKMLVESALHELSLTTPNNETLIVACAKDRFHITLVFAPNQWIDAPLAPDGPVRYRFDAAEFQDLQSGYWVWGGWGTLRVVVPGAARALTERIGGSRRLEIKARKTGGRWATADMALGASADAVAQLLAACDRF